MTNNQENFSNLRQVLECAREAPLSCSADFPVCCIAGFQTRSSGEDSSTYELRMVRRFGNRRYSRFGNLRYYEGPRSVLAREAAAALQTAGALFEPSLKRQSLSLFRLWNLELLWRLVLGIWSF